MIDEDAAPRLSAAVSALDESLQEDLDQLRRDGVFRPLRVLESPQAAEVVIGGRRLVNLSSNNYLGLNTHPRLIEAAVQAAREWGAGSGAVRTIAGTQTLHEELERRLAVFKKTPAALTFQSGYAVNVGVLSAMLEDGDVVVSDKLNHASIIDGIRLTKADRILYEHTDVDDAERALKQARDKGYRRILLVTDGVFSMDGDIAPLPQLVERAEQYGAAVMVDDAHASGVLGTNGRGTTDHFGLHGRVALNIGTLSKAVGVLGGYIASTQNVRDYLIHKGRPFLFSSSHPPAVVAACIAAVDVLEQEPELIDRLWENTRYYKEKLRELGFDLGRSETPITPVMCGEANVAMQLSDMLLERGVFAQGIGFPTVPRGQARVRTIVCATHSREQLDRALDAFADAGRKLDLRRS
ncbi:MAG TPA: glycine C-acetyltransferase [Candidatus Dormibacteraeota bacterium]|jgi:glycine C-acetyltransferase|nr:glycine C-acetyltransferase [Candidatus Dormibacteraeota bacterium]